MSMCRLRGASHRAAPRSIAQQIPHTPFPGAQPITRGVRMTNEQLRRQQFIAGLHAVATFYETHPEAYYDGMHLSLNMYVWGSAARKTLITMAKAFGLCTKTYDDKNVTVARRFSEQVTLAVFAPRAKVCRRIV